MTSNTSIWWIRRDLRLSDNPALAHALSSSRKVIPLFILDDALLKSRYAAEKRTAFLFDGLRSLDQDIRTRGGRLIVRHGSPSHVLRDLLRNEGIDQIVPSVISRLTHDTGMMRW